MSDARYVVVGSDLRQLFVESSWRLRTLDEVRKTLDARRKNGAVGAMTVLEVMTVHIFEQSKPSLQETIIDMEREG